MGSIPEAVSFALKNNSEKKLANLSFAKKIEILTQLRQRDLIMSAARKKK